MSKNKSFSIPSSEEASRYEDETELKRSSQYNLYHENQQEITLNKQAGLFKLRDKAFFEHMRAVRQQGSNIGLLPDFKTTFPIPSGLMQKKLSSKLDNYDPKLDKYLRDFEDYHNAQKAFEDSLQDSYQRLRILEDQMRATVLPRILYFVFQWLPTIFSLYRLFNPRNTIDAIVKESRELLIEHTSITAKIGQLTENFKQEWHFVRVEEDKITKEQLHSFKDKQQTHYALLAKQTAADKAILAYGNEALHTAYDAFKQHSTQGHLLALCEHVIKCGYHQTLVEGKNTLEDVLPTFEALYPSMNVVLPQLQKVMLHNLIEADKFQQLHTEFDTQVKRRDELLLAVTKDEHKIHISEALIAELSIVKEANNPIEMLEKRIKSSNNNHLLNKMLTRLIQSNTLSNTNIKEYIQNASKHLETEKKSIAKLKPTLEKRQYFTQKLEKFLKVKTGETLLELYQVMMDPKYLDIHNALPILTSLYSQEIHQLKEEQQNRIPTISSNQQFELMKNYYSKLIEIKKSKEDTYKTLAESLESFIKSPNWEHLTQIEEAIQTTPKYVNNSELLKLITQIMTLCAVNKPQAKKYRVIPERMAQPKNTRLKIDDKAENATLIHEEDKPSPKTRTLDENAKYVHFINSSAHLSEEKSHMNPSRNLNKLYTNRDNAFFDYLYSEENVRAQTLKNHAKYHVITTHFTGHNQDVLTVRCRKLPHNNPLKLKLFDFIIKPSWTHLEALDHAMRKNPEYFKNNDIDSLLIDIMKLFSETVQNERLAHNKKSTSQDNKTHGFFNETKPKKSIAQKTHLLLSDINTYAIRSLGVTVPDEEKWQVIGTVGLLLLEHVEFLMAADIEMSKEDRLLLKNVLSFLDNILSPDRIKPTEQASTKIKQQLETLDIDHPVRIATEFIINTVQDTQEYLSIDTKPAQMKLKNRIQEVIPEYKNKIQYPPKGRRTSNDYKWSSIYDLEQILEDYLHQLDASASKAHAVENASIKEVIEHLKKIGSIVRRDPNESMSLKDIFAKLHKTLDTLHNHPIREAADFILETIEDTDQYLALPHHPSYKGP